MFKNGLKFNESTYMPHDDEIRAKYHYHKLLDTLQSNRSVSLSHESAHEHYNKAADAEKLGYKSSAEWHRDIAARHAAKAEELSKK